MARMRTLKPEAFSSLSLSDVERGVRWTFSGLWTVCDDEGRAVPEPRLLKASIYPLDDAITPAVIEADLRELERIHAVCFYTVGGRQYVHVPSWHDHQHPNRKVASKLPPCPKGEHVPDPARSTDCSTENSTDMQRSELTVSPPDQLTPVVVVESRGDVGVEEASQSPRPPTALALRAETAQTIVARWLEHCRKRPPDSVIGQTSKHIKALLAEGIDPNDVEHGVAQWATKGLNPASLASVVNEVMNARPRARPATTDSRAAAALELSQRLKASGE